MANSITTAAARVLKSKIDARDCPLAVFSEGHFSWTATRIDTASYAKRIRLEPHKLIGVYDLFATFNDLVEDLEAAGIK